MERSVNTFAIYQIEKSQAINLLERVADRLNQSQIDLQQDGQDFDYDNLDAYNAVTRLISRVEGLRTQLDAQTVTLTEVADLLRNIEDAKRGSPCEYAATYFSNFNIDRDEFLLAARYQLKTADELLRSCSHGTDNTEVCLSCLSHDEGIF